MTVEILFEKAYLFGDEFNAEYLRRCLPDAEFVCTDLRDKPYFAEHTPDIIYMGAMSERNQLRAIEALMPYRDRLADLVEQGIHILFTGNSVDVLGTHIHVIEADGKTENTHKALGLFPCHAELTMNKRFFCSLLGNACGCDIVGFKTQFGHTYELPEEYGFIRVERGKGIYPGASMEGIHKNNLYATYLIGPILVMNPTFTKFFLKSAGADVTLPFEDVSMKAYEIRLAEFKDRSRTGIG